MKRTPAKLSALLLAALLLLPLQQVAAAEAAPQADPPESNTRYGSLPIEMNVETIQVNPDNLLAVEDTGALYGWGVNNYGVLPSAADQTLVGMTRIDIPGRVVDVQSVRESGMALLEDGKLYSWGWEHATVESVNWPATKLNAAGNAYHDPYWVEEFDDITEMRGSYVRLGNGEVWGWHIFMNRAGVPATNPRAAHRLVYDAEGETIDSFVRLDDFRNGILVQDANGTVYLSTVAYNPYNKNFILPIAPEYRNVAAGAYLVPTTLPADYRQFEISLRDEMAFLVTGDNNLLVWGDTSIVNSGTTEKYETPTMIVDTGDVDKIAVTLKATFMLKTDGTLWAAGSNEYHLLGAGPDRTIQHDTFTQLPILEGETITDVVTGQTYVYVKTESGDWYAWGMSEFLSPLDLKYSNPNHPVLIFKNTGEPGNPDPGDPGEPEDPDPGDTHNIKITVSYPDGAAEDVVYQYDAPMGQPFSAAFDYLDGYELDRVRNRALMYNVDVVNKVVEIASVEEDLDLLLEFVPKEYKITVVPRYSDGALEETTARHYVNHGQPFSTTFDMLEDYAIANIEMDVLGFDISRSRRTIDVESITGNMTVIITFEPR